MAPWRRNGRRIELPEPPAEGEEVVVGEALAAEEQRRVRVPGTLDEVEVVTGQSDGRHTVVTSRELKPGMKVVTSVKAADE